MKYIAPIKIKIATPIEPFQVDSGIIFRALTEKEIEQIFGLTNVQYDSDARIIHCTRKFSLDYFFHVSGMTELERQSLMSSRHAFEIDQDSIEEVKNFLMI